ncbi:uncharacterized protein LOC111684897 isoform X3 [Lucilia cuprina]|uniref:uncharacterized protein LOC111684897 isoform X3 n=1 Tax=Lucilia cuprina TaxID=7375 RepID=UPI001F06BC03|nr:uncharacterized protein LOC111684897 isoform X3 [Lucilia cuprina]
MESTGGSSGSAMTAAAAMPSPSVVADGSKVFCSSLFKATNYEFDPSISEEERRFYLKAYPTVDVVRERKTHCTVCKVHIGTAPVQENGIKMHPILRVTHCNKCHDFYNSGEFSKGEDGSELYCRWCGQGGEVYCCSSCPYVFCKSCIVKNLSRGVVADIEQNENWNCFSCAPKILWPLRAQHWALMNYIEQQKKEIYALHLSESELKLNLSKDRSRCCRLAKSKCGNMSDSMESLDSVASKRSHGSSQSAKKPMKHSATPSPQQMNAAKRAKTNDEVVCTPDLLSMLEPDCQITVSQKSNRPMNTPSATTPKIMSIQQPQAGYGAMSSTPKTSAPPPLVLRNTAIKLRPAAPPPVVRRTIIGPRTPTPGGNGTPVYHTINGYRIDLNSAAQQETFRLPNGKLIQVKRQGPPTPQNASPTANNWQRMSSPQPQRVIPQTIASRPVQITQHPYNISVQQQPGPHPQVVRYHNSMIGSTSISQVNHNGTTIQVVNGQMPAGPQQAQQQQQQQIQLSGPVRPVMVRHVFPDNPIGQARAGLQDQVFNAMEICTHLTNKVQTLTNSNAYKQARNFLEVKELYIHLSYLLTYAIGRFKSLQDKCLGDMRTLGFGNDADCLENGQLAADKQASDDEDNEIEIVEPKTDLITLDSDDDEPSATSPTKNQQTTNAPNKTQQQTYSSTQHSADVKIKPASIAQANRQVVIKPAATAAVTPPAEENIDLMSMAQSFLASMLEVDIQEGPVNSPGSDSSGQKKQPRKKLTNKPNPTLLKQKALMEQERLEEMKRNDQKLKMKCSVELKKAEEVFPFAKEMLEAKAKEKQEQEETKKHKLEQKEVIELEDDTDKSNEKLEDSLSSSTEEKKENNDKNSSSSTEIEEKKANAENSIEIIEINNSAVEEKDNEKDTSMDITEKEVSIEVLEDTTIENIEEKENSKETKEKETLKEIIDKTEDDIKEKEDNQKKEQVKENEVKVIEDKTEAADKKQENEKDQTDKVMEIDEKSPATPTRDEPMEIDENNEESIQKDPDISEDNKTKSNEIMQNENKQEMEKIIMTATENNDKNEDKELEKVLTQKEEKELKNEKELTKPTNETLLNDKKELDNTTAISIEIVKDKENDETVKEKANVEATNKTLPSSTAADLNNKELETNKTIAIDNETNTTSSNGNV